MLWQKNVIGYFVNHVIYNPITSLSFFSSFFFQFILQPYPFGYVVTFARAFAHLKKSLRAINHTLSKNHRTAPALESLY